MKIKIVILDGFAVNPGDLDWRALDEIGEATVYPRTSPEQVLQRAAETEIILTNKTVITAEHIRSLKKLKYIGILATGYNVVDVNAAHENDICVTNIPAYSTNSVAQMVFSHILNITNHVARYTTLNRRGRWSANPDFCYYDLYMTELSGKNFGIVGLGNIGLAVAKIADAFNMSVHAYTSKNNSKIPTYITRCSLDELFKKSDILTLHCPLTSATKDIVNATRLASMKNSAIVINTSRGQLVNEQDMAEALEHHAISAYGTDVLSQEPPSVHNPLLQQPNAYITPHIAWATLESRKRLMNICIENIRAFINGLPINKI